MPAITRRKVFYIPGYDPIPPRRYRELFRSEGADQAAISGYDLTLGPPVQTQKRFGWTASATIAGQQSGAEFEVLQWSDIVKHSMSIGILETYILLFQTAWIYIGSGALWRLMRLRQGPVIAALYPIGLLLLQAVIAAVLGWFGASLTRWGLTLMGGAIPEWLIIGISACVGGALFYVTLRGFKSWDGKFFAYYLMHDYAYSARLKGKNPPELETRMEAFKHDIRQAVSESYDEVLIVGHSSGAHLGVSILSDLLREGLPDGAADIGFLSLGQVVPMVAFLPNAWRLRADLNYLSGQDRIAWVDVTAPGDGCAFALVDPAAVCGVAPDVQTGPLVLSAAFTQTLSPEKWNALKRRYFRLHFQYLCAFDRPNDYDYFQITTGAVSLKDRFQGRKPSPSCLRDPVSKYTSVMP